MPDWIEANTEVATALFAALFASLGYFYRARQEKRENLKVALYWLLEIWHRVTILSWSSYDDFYDRLILRFRQRHPHLPFSDAEAAASKAHFIPILRNSLAAHAMANFDGFQNAYNEAVQSVARSNPVYAYKIRATSLKDRIAYLDTYFGAAFESVPNESSMSPFVKGMRGKVDDLSYADEVLDLEIIIRGLAWRISLSTYLETHRAIHARKAKLKKIEEARLDTAIDSLADEIRKYYPEARVGCGE